MAPLYLNVNALKGCEKKMDSSSLGKTQSALSVAKERKKSFTRFSALCVLSKKERVNSYLKRKLPFLIFFCIKVLQCTHTHTSTYTCVYMYIYMKRYNPHFIKCYVVSTRVWERLGTNVYMQCNILQWTASRKGTSRTTFCRMWATWGLPMNEAQQCTGEPSELHSQRSLQNWTNIHDSLFV